MKIIQISAMPTGSSKECTDNMYALYALVEDGTVYKLRGDKEWVQMPNIQLPVSNQSPQNN